MEQSHPNPNPSQTRQVADSQQTTTPSRTGPAAPAQAAYGQRIPLTCNRCQTKESQCDRTTATCAICVDCHCGCISAQAEDRSQEAWKAKIETLESEIHRYEDIIDGMELGSDSDVMQLLQQLRTNENKRNVGNEHPSEDSRHARR